MRSDRAALASCSTGPLWDLPEPIGFFGCWSIPPGSTRSSRRLKKEYEVSALVGPRGRFISRSIAREERFGNPASVYLRRAVKSGAANGIYSGFTLEGFQNYTAFTRSPMTGWSAHVAVASNQIDNPANRFLASLGIAGALSLALAGVLVWYALRQAATGRRIAERMQQAQKLEALGQLTGGIAHDFNNLLTPIVGALHFLSLKPELDARARRLAGGALASAERAAKLTAQLLAFSRRQKLQIEPIDVSAMMEEVSNLVRQSIGDTHQLEVTESNGLCAYCDLNQLELAILNLVLNARDASPPGSTIHITVDADGEPETGRVMISVRDEGNGMDQDTQRRAFEPFFTTKQQGSGTGLGLAQVFGMAEQSGGSVRIDSAPGKGTSVTITLRRCPIAPRSPVSPSRAAKLERQRPLRLLVADDEPEVRMAIVRPLEDAGHIVDVVSDGPTALPAITERPFDLVLIDFAMPGMNGAELIQRAREVRADTRFLIISGYSDSNAIAVAAPDTAILRKPFAATELSDRVKELLA